MVYEALCLVGKSETSVLYTLYKTIWQPLYTAFDVPKDEKEGLQRFLRDWKDDYQRYCQTYKNAFLKMRTWPKAMGQIMPVFQDHWDGIVSTEEASIYFVERILTPEFIPVMLEKYSIHFRTKEEEQEWKPLDHSVPALQKEMSKLIQQAFQGMTQFKLSHAFEEQVQILKMSAGEGGGGGGGMMILDHFLERVKMMVFEQWALPFLMYIHVICQQAGPRYANGKAWKKNPDAYSVENEPAFNIAMQVQSLLGNEVVRKQILDDNSLGGVQYRPLFQTGLLYLLSDTLEHSTNPNDFTLRTHVQDMLNRAILNVSSVSTNLFGSSSKRRRLEPTAAPLLLKPPIKEEEEVVVKMETTAFGSSPVESTAFGSSPVESTAFGSSPVEPKAVEFSIKQEVKQEVDGLVVKEEPNFKEEVMDVSSVERGPLALPAFTPTGRKSRHQPL
jgi:hypothetical protein